MALMEKQLNAIRARCKRMGIRNIIDFIENIKLALTMFICQVRNNGFEKDVIAAFCAGGDYHRLMGMIAIKTGLDHDGFVEALKRGEIKYEPQKVRPFYEQIGMTVQVLLNGDWHNAVIENGYRTHDGIINARMEDGRGFWCGEDRHDEFVREVPHE